ncbi:hypothetical protein EVAR_3826_1 [Eumeta japonica]|uniref:Uncharacterized protein n=1 Tax=Eumeta variegata TaxID=151549 RepID=A0A4C1ST43_EUMVA|nr:hypothetical protein EVAR_3826_1 [Eumeta japonica]
MSRGRSSNSTRLTHQPHKYFYTRVSTVCAVARFSFQFLRFPCSSEWTRRPQFAGSRMIADDTLSNQFADSAAGVKLLLVARRARCR